MTGQEHILDYLRRHQGPQRIGDIARTWQGKIDSLYASASELYRAGTIVRSGPGVYALPDAGEPAHEPTGEEPAASSFLEPQPRKPRQKPAPVETPESTAADAPPEPELELAAWHTGELTVRRGDQVVLLQPGEVQTLLRFAGRMLQEEA